MAARMTYDCSGSAIFSSCDCPDTTCVVGEAHIMLHCTRCKAFVIGCYWKALCVVRIGNRSFGPIRADVQANERCDNPERTLDAAVGCSYVLYFPSIWAVVSLVYGNLSSWVLEGVMALYTTCVLPRARCMSSLVPLCA